MSIKTAQSAQARSSHSVRTRAAPEGKCSGTFVSAGESRASYPLKSGAYKLDEARRILEQHLETVKAIELIVMTRSRPHPNELLGSCVAGERGKWLKSVPKSIASCLGYLVLPSVQALTGDRVPLERTRRFLDHARIETARIVARCDEVTALVAPSTGHGYDILRRGSSLITRLLIETIALVQAAIEQNRTFALRVVRA